MAIYLWGAWLEGEELLDDKNKLPEEIGIVRFNHPLGAWVLEFSRNSYGYRVVVDGMPVPDPKPASMTLSFPKEIRVGLPITLRIEKA